MGTTTRGYRPPPGTGPGAARRPEWLLALHDAIHERFRGPVRVSALAEDAGVHPVHAARVFRRHFGCTISEYVCALRVETARSELADGRRPLAAIAYSTGFADQAHFTRRFKERVGVAPGQYRKIAIG